MSEPVDPKYREQMRAIGRVLDDQLNDGKRPRHTGFVLLMFDFGEPTPRSRMNYLSNAERPDIIVALKELLANFEGRMMPDTRE